MCRQEQEAKTPHTKKTVRYGNSSVAISAICTGYGRVMRHPHFKGCLK